MIITLFSAAICFLDFKRFYEISRKKVELSLLVAVLRKIAVGRLATLRSSVFQELLNYRANRLVTNFLPNRNPLLTFPNFDRSIGLFLSHRNRMFQLDRRQNNETIHDGGGQIRST